MGALLEGSVPIELSTMEAEPHEALGIEKGEDEVDSILRGRENVLDTLQIDISSLRIGKKQCVLPGCLGINDSLTIETGIQLTNY